MAIEIAQKLDYYQPCLRCSFQEVSRESTLAAVSIGLLDTSLMLVKALLK